MELAFKKSAVAGIFAGAAFLAACGPADVPVTLVASDGTIVSTTVKQGSTPVSLVDENGTSVSCREEFSERASIGTTRHFVVCAETERVIARRQWLDRLYGNGDAAAAGAVAAASGAAVATGMIIIN